MIHESIILEFCLLTHSFQSTIMSLTLSNRETFLYHNIKCYDLTKKIQKIKNKIKIVLVIVFLLIIALCK
jgi:hypothetical protein